jgi:hypothetical protein
VLLLSGTFERFDEDRARSVGADGHITKPFEAQALVDRVNQLLAHAEAARPVGGGSDTTVLVAEQPSASGDAFDFFDEEFAATSPSAAAAPTATTLLEDDGGASLSAMPIELESAVEDEIAEASEAVAISSFDDDIDPPADEGHATTVLFDVSESDRARPVEPEPSGRQPADSAHSAPAAATTARRRRAFAAPPPFPRRASTTLRLRLRGRVAARFAASPSPPNRPPPSPSAPADPARSSSRSGARRAVTPPPVPASAPARAARMSVPSSAHIE